MKNIFFDTEGKLKKIRIAGTAAAVLFLLFFCYALAGTVNPSKSYAERLLQKNGGIPEQDESDIYSREVSYRRNEALYRQITEVCRTLKEGEYSDKFSVNGGFRPPAATSEGAQAPQENQWMQEFPYAENNLSEGSEPSGTELVITYEPSGMDTLNNSGESGMCSHLRWMVYGSDDGTMDAEELEETMQKKADKEWSWQESGDGLQKLICPVCGFVAGDMNLMRLRLSDMKFIDDLEKLGFRNLKLFLKCVDQYYDGYPEPGIGYRYSIFSNGAVITYTSTSFSITYRYQDYYLNDTFPEEITDKIGEGWGVAYARTEGAHDILALQTRAWGNDYPGLYHYAEETDEEESGRLKKLLADAAEIGINGVPSKLMLLYFQDGKLIGLRINAEIQKGEEIYFTKEDGVTAAKFLTEFGVSQTEAERFVMEFKGGSKELSGTAGSCYWEYTPGSDSSWLDFYTR